MTSEDLIDLTAQMKRLGVLYFEINGAKVVFNDGPPHQTAGLLFEDQRSLLPDLKGFSGQQIVEMLEGEETIDPDGRPASTGFDDEDLFGSSS